MPIDWCETLGDTAQDLRLRPIEDPDLPFLASLYASTREPELAPLDWSEQRKRSFLQGQFKAQHEHYQAHFAGAHWLLIEKGGKAIGRIYLHETGDEIRLIDVALVPECRAQGVGTAMMDRLLAAAGRLGLPVRLHVESFNPAFRLYQRLGFEHLENRGVYQFMEKQSAAD